MLDFYVCGLIQVLERKPLLAVGPTLYKISQIILLAGCKCVIYCNASAVKT